MTSFDEIETESGFSLETKLIGVPQLATRLAVSERSIREWIKQGKLVAVHLGKRVLVSEQGLLDFLAPAKGR